MPVTQVEARDTFMACGIEEVLGEPGPIVIEKEQEVHIHFRFGDVCVESITARDLQTNRVRRVFTTECHARKLTYGFPACIHVAHDGERCIYHYHVRFNNGDPFGDVVKVPGRRRWGRKWSWLSCRMRTSTRRTRSSWSRQRE